MMIPVELTSIAWLQFFISTLEASLSDRDLKHLAKEEKGELTRVEINCVQSPGRGRPSPDDRKLCALSFNYSSPVQLHLIF